jgi:pyridoxal phosphate-dependent aminotransferase EpsN
MGGDEITFVEEAFRSNYIAPLGPQVDRFEEEFASQLGVRYGAAVSSGTAGLHLALRYAGVQTGDEVFCSSFTFVATANAILYLGAQPVFIDSDYLSWNMDPILLEMELQKRAEQRKLPKALVLVHLYGQSANIEEILRICEKYDVFLIEDAAESLGGDFKGKPTGTFGRVGVFSFNGNKIITTSGGGMVVSNDLRLIEKIKFWATQARENVSHYEHAEMGYNYRMSNVLAGIGRGQLRVLSERVKKKKEIFNFYIKHLSDLTGVTFMPVPVWSNSTHWLSCLTVDPQISGISRDVLIDELEKNNIESRPTWKPLHLQPLFNNSQVVGGEVSEDLFHKGLCLPSGTALRDEDLDRIVSVVRDCFRKSGQC